MQYKTIRYEIDDGVAVITLNRPHRNNAWTGRMETEYHHAMYYADRDDTVGVIVLTGGGRNFCVGADSKALEIHAGAGRYDSGIREPLLEPGDPEHPAHGTPHGFPMAMAKPVISAINGAAAGIGFVVVCFTDIRIAAEGAKLTPSSSKLGLPGEHAVSWILPRLIGYGRAMELMLSSRVVNTEEALGDRPGERGVPEGAAVGAGVGVRPQPHRLRRAVLAAGDQGPAVARPLPAATGVRRRVRAAHQRDGRQRRLQPGGRRAHRAPLPRFARSYRRG